MLKTTRRLVSGIAEDKQSKILSEDKVEAFVPYEIFPCFQLQELFYTENNPQTLQTRNFNKPYNIELPEGAFRFLLLRMPTRKEAEACMKAAGQEIPADWTKYNVHSTDSIDYVYILSGEVDYVVGDRITKLKQGDFLAQIGPEHTWVNNSDNPCQMLCIMVGIKPSGERKLMAIE